MIVRLILIGVLALVAVGALAFVVVMANRLTRGTQPAETFTAPVDRARDAVARERAAARASRMDEDWQKQVNEGLKQVTPRASLLGLIITSILILLVMAGGVAALTQIVPNALDRGMVAIWGAPALWPTVDGRITGERIDDTRGGTYAGVVTFTYSVEGTTFNEQQILTWREDYATAQAALAPYEPGQAVAIYYPPILKSAGLVAPPAAFDYQSSFLMIGILIMLMVTVGLAVAFRVQYLRDVKLVRG